MQLKDYHRQFLKAISFLPLIAAMRLTTFTDYSLRVLMYLALDPERLATIPEIAAAYGISENHLMKVVHQLARSGVIESIRGKGGGVRLARSPEQIRLGEVVRTSEGSGAIVECFTPESNTCRIAPSCKLASVLAGAFNALYESLDAHTLADLVANRQVLRRALAPAVRTAAKERANR
jgi:Rrf2 family nitric oxide-sensitive transcriptional repressor